MLRTVVPWHEYEQMKTFDLSRPGEGRMGDVAGNAKARRAMTAAGLAASDTYTATLRPSV